MRSQSLHVIDKMTSISILLSIFSIAIFSCISATRLQLRLCHDNIHTGEYLIPKPHKCVRQNATLIQRCGVTIYDPVPKRKMIPIYKCSVISTALKTTYFFFGAKTCDETALINPAPSVEACADWVRTKRASGYGPLISSNVMTWSTHNSNEQKCVWPKGYTHTAYNAILIKSTTLYDHAHDQISSAIEAMTNCKLVVMILMTYRVFCKLSVKLVSCMTNYIILLEVDPTQKIQQICYTYIKI